MGIRFAPSIVFYDNKTADYIDNLNLIGVDVFVFYRQISLDFRQNLSYTYGHYIKKDLNYLDKKLTNSQSLRIEFSNLGLGYMINLKNNFSLNPYLGRQFFWFTEDEPNKNLIRVGGYTFAIELNKWFFKEKSCCVYIRDQFNITNLWKVNNNLGNFANIIEVGVGGRFGVLK
jgi:hypothetical protein